MKKLIIGALAMTSTIAATAAEYQTDTFKTKGGKRVSELLAGSGIDVRIRNYQ